jgi:hypothetical protein
VPSLGALSVSSAIVPPYLTITQYTEIEFVLLSCSAGERTPLDSGDEERSRVHVTELIDEITL